MKKILSIVLLSVVLLSAMIVPSFAVSLDYWEGGAGLEGYYSLKVDSPLRFLNVGTFNTNSFESVFLYEDKVIVMDGGLTVSVGETIDSGGTIDLFVYSGLLNVFSTSDLENSINEEAFMLTLPLYSSSVYDFYGFVIGSNVLENIELIYNAYVSENPDFQDLVPYNLFVTICTNYAKTSRTPIMGSITSDYNNFIRLNTTFTASLSIMDLTPPPPIVIEETGNVFTSVISWAGSFVNTVFNNTGLLILFLLGVGISIVLVAIRILRKVMWSK